MSTHNGSQKRFRRLQKAIKPYGLEILQYSKHPAVYDKEGKRITVISGSPKSIEHTEVYAFKRLQNDGYIPKDAKL